jgi:hypothetical protein
MILSPEVIRIHHVEQLLMLDSLWPWVVGNGHVEDLNYKDVSGTHQ